MREERIALKDVADAALAGGKIHLFSRCPFAEERLAIQDYLSLVG
jgi:hypothetical protein